MKELYIVRHAIAEDRIEFAKKGLLDSERPITEQGRAKMIKISEWLARQISGDLDLIINSPLLRSRQTSEILKNILKFRDFKQWDELEPSTQASDLYAKITAELNLDGRLSFNSKKDKSLLDEKKIMIVGHEPQLTKLIEIVLGSKTASHNFFLGSFKIKKGGVVCIEFKPDPVLKWFVTPKNILSI